MKDINIKSALDSIGIRAQGRDQNYDDDNHLAESDSFTFIIEVDDILAAYGSSFILKDVFDQIGNLAVIYRELIHPTISELYNNNYEDMSRLDNIEKDDDIANYTYDSLENKLFLLIDRRVRTVDISVSNDDVILLCVTVINLILNHIRSLIDDAAACRPRGEVPTAINILERGKATLIPDERTPLMMEIYIEFYWVYI